MSTLLILLANARESATAALPAVQAELIRTATSEQMGIALFGVAAIWLSQDAREEVRRWSCWCGLAAQPFWFYTTFTHHQWAVFFLSFFYTWSWIKGVRSYWVPYWRYQAYRRKQARETPAKPVNQWTPADIDAHIATLPPRAAGYVRREMGAWPREGPRDFGERP